ncbi:hypothetical protein [Microbacterium rhizophilus]|uniref:hypothetical protein n=1 Tax=Microbacterium rhizophilus TaxID=3138934 RepID=UPI0031EE16EC
MSGALVVAALGMGGLGAGTLGTPAEAETRPEPGGFVCGLARSGGPAVRCVWRDAPLGESLRTRPPAPLRSVAPTPAP